MKLERLLTALKGTEGWSPTVYIDTTGHLTIGFGLNLGKLELPPGVTVRIRPVNGITMACGEHLLLGLVLATLEELRRALPWWEGLDEIRQEVLADMAYNLGVPGLMKWPMFLNQVRHGQYEWAARNMESTRWYRQVGRRARRLVAMMRTGADPGLRSVARRTFPRSYKRGKQR